MNFGCALQLLKNGQHVRRRGWPSKETYLSYQTSCVSDKPIFTFIALHTAPGSVSIWWVAQTDIIAEDWVIVE